jgi:hypothetical protein
MSRVLRIACCTLALAAFAGPARPDQPPSAPPVRQANPGEAATGEVVSETAQELHINTRPCSATRAVVIFKRPYSRDSAGTITCGAVVKALVQAVQR